MVQCCRCRPPATELVAKAVCAGSGTPRAAPILSDATLRARRCQPQTVRAQRLASRQPFVARTMCAAARVEPRPRASPCQPRQPVHLRRVKAGEGSFGERATGPEQRRRRAEPKCRGVRASDTGGRNPPRLRCGMSKYREVAGWRSGRGVGHARYQPVRGFRQDSAVLHPQTSLGLCKGLLGPRACR
jgi:hypothetical protein